MYIENIKIQNFRNYKLLSLKFNKGINIIYGKNGQGKTNLLESIYVLSLTKSHKSFIDSNLIKKNEAFAIVKGKLKKDNISKNLEVYISEKEKKLKVDNIEEKKISNYTSIMNTIIFYPEDLEIIKGSPILRRKYMNVELSQLYSSYLEILNDYNKLLKMRNDFFKKLKDNYYNQLYLEQLNDYYIKKSILIYKMRKKYIEKINENISDIFYNISGIQNLKIKYKSNINLDTNNSDELYDNMKNKIDSVFNVEKKLKTTLIGPNRDDLEFYIDEKNLKLYGSQGQQRMAILALKLSEIELFKNVKGEYPILLLDDVFSELDRKKRNNLLKYIKEDIQTFITTTDLSLISRKLINNSITIEIEDGTVKKIGGVN